MKRIALALICLLLLSSHVTMAAPQGKETSHREAQALELMDKSGLNEQIQNTPETLKTAIKNGFRRTSPDVEKLPDEVVNQITGIISNTFKPDTINRILVEHIQSELSPDDIQSVLAWLDSPLGKEITRLEEISSTPEAYKEMLSVVSSLKLASDYDQRLKLMREIDQSVNATELVLDRMLNMQIVTVTAMASAFPSEEVPSAEMIKAKFNENRYDISQAISREIILGALYTYRDVSQSDIEKYIAFMKTDYGKKYHEVIHEGMNDAYAHCGKLFGKAVGSLVVGQKKNTFEKTFVQQYPQER